MCKPLIGVQSKKNALETAIIMSHPNQKIMYNKIHQKKNDYFTRFAEIYNFKCAYCGVSSKFQSIDLFEIDHYVCEKAFEDSPAGRAEAGRAENLVFSCYACNRNKGSLHITEEYLNLLNPDDNSIASIFNREVDYSISINPEYSNDAFINSFFEKLMLGAEFRRLDYLLLELISHEYKMREHNVKAANEISAKIVQILEKRNTISVTGHRISTENNE